MSHQQDITIELSGQFAVSSFPCDESTTDYHSNPNGFEFAEPASRIGWFTIARFSLDVHSLDNSFHEPKPSLHLPWSFRCFFFSWKSQTTKLDMLCRCFVWSVSRAEPRNQISTLSETNFKWFSVHRVFGSRSCSPIPLSPHSETFRLRIETVRHRANQNRLIPFHRDCQWHSCFRPFNIDFNKACRNCARKLKRRLATE